MRNQGVKNLFVQKLERAIDNDEMFAAIFVDEFGGVQCAMGGDAKTKTFVKYCAEQAMSNAINEDLRARRRLAGKE